MTVLNKVKSSSTYNSLLLGIGTEKWKLYVDVELERLR